MTPEERREAQQQAISRAIYADLFDGMRGGQVTTNIDKLVSDVAECVLENWVDIQLTDTEPAVAGSIRYGFVESSHHGRMCARYRGRPCDCDRVSEFVINYPEGHPKR